MNSIKKLSRLKLVNFIKIIGIDSLAELIVVDGKVYTPSQIKDHNNFEVVDLKDCIISPGFIDPQVNGLNTCNFWTIKNLKEQEGFALIDEVRRKLAFSGVVAFCPTLITAATDEIVKSIDYINSYIKQSNPDIGAKILGVHIEGIFITKYGVHKSKYVQKDLLVKNLAPFIKENVIIFTLAPELDKTGEAIKFLQDNGILVSVGHSNAIFAEGKAVIETYNLKTVTHMFNSLRGIEGFSHRGNGDLNLNILKEKLNDKNIDPAKDGILLALLKNKEVLCMTIADGIHVNKEVIRFLNEIKGQNHFALSSDAVSSDFFNAAKSKGMLGGGQSTIDKCVSNLIDWKVSKTEDSLLSASSSISKQLKVAKLLGLGEISIGREANLVFWDTKKNVVKGTIIGQNVFFNY